MKYGSLAAVLYQEIAVPIEKNIALLRSEMISGFEFLYAENEKREQEHLIVNEQFKRIDKKF